MRQVILSLLMLTATMHSLGQILPIASMPLNGQPSTTMSGFSAPPSGGLSGSGLPPISGYVADDSYVLRAGDVLTFQILEDKLVGITNTPDTLTVEDSGELEVPYVGRVTAVGKTCKILSEEITTALQTNYYQHATVELSVDVANRLWGRIYIFGQVRLPGELDVAVGENLTAGQAIMRAGGFADFADEKKVKLVRVSPGGGESKPINLDMDQILDQGNISQDVHLQPGDMIIVPSRLINF